jgi:hypothetical protein
VKERFAMEETILYNGATLAKCELLARLTPHAWASLSAKELHAHIAACTDAIRVPWERGKQHSGDVDESDIPNLDEPAPVPSRRQRKRSLAKVCEVARKAGADHVITDGVVIAFSPAAAVPESSAAAVPESSANEWDAVLENDHDPH